MRDPLDPFEPDEETKQANDMLVLAVLCTVSILIFIALIMRVFGHAAAVWLNGLM